MKGYQILHPIKHKSKTMKEGIVFMSETEAAMLLAGGHVMGPIDATPSEDQDIPIDAQALTAKAPRANARAVKK